jgi:hypothetical protein
MTCRDLEASLAAEKVSNDIGATIEVDASETDKQLREVVRRHHERTRNRVGRSRNKSCKVSVSTLL